MRVLVQKKVGKKKYVYSIEKNRVDTNHICNFRGKKKKRKEKHNEELSKLFQVFRKSFLLYHRVHNHEEIIVFLKKSTKKAGSHVTYGW